MYKNLFIRDKKRAGFSLVEMLVAIAVFMVLVTILAGIYVAFTRNQNRAKVSQDMLNNLQYNFEVMSRQIRDNSIVDFSGTCPIAGYAGACILLEKEDGSLFAFGYKDNALEYILVGRDASGTYSILNTPGSLTQLLSEDVNNIKVDLLKFNIQPNTNPYLEGAINKQPKVTIALQATYSGLAAADVSYNLQTTVSSRIYKR